MNRMIEKGTLVNILNTYLEDTDLIDVADFQLILEEFGTNYTPEGSVIK